MRSLWLLWLMAIGLWAQSQPTTRVLFVVDYSLSMAGKWEKRPKIQVLRTAMERLVQDLRDNHPDIAVGLRLFGHKSPKHWNDCRDTRLEVPIGLGTHAKIAEKLNLYEPRGVTPLAYTLQQVQKDFPTSDGRNILILITDGAESCGGDPCAVMEALKSRNIILKPFIIGLQLDASAVATLSCAGTVYNAEKEQDLDVILRKITERIVALSSLTVELLDEARRPIETNLPMVFYEHETQKPRYVFYHTLNALGQPDTLYLDPVITYDLTVYTTPPVSRNKLQLKPGQHNIIRIPSPTGYLQTSMEQITIEADVQGKLQGIVRDPRTHQLVVLQGPQERKRLLARTYEMELLTLPPIEVPNIQLHSGKTTRVTIPAPGVVVLYVMYPGVGSILRRTADGVEKVYEIPKNQKRVILALQPGKYTIVYKPDFVKKSMESRVKEFTIQSNQSIRITLN